MTNKHGPRFSRGLSILKTLLLISILIPTEKNIAQTIQRPAITGIASIDLRTSDINKSINFYNRLLGYKYKSHFASTSQSESFSIQLSNRQSILIEGGLPESQDERLTSIGLQTSDIEAMRVYLKSKGILVPDKVTKDRNNNAFFSILDPERHVLKFIQYASTGTQNFDISDSVDLISDRILHAGITIQNINKANDFYVGILGFSEIWRGGPNDSTTAWIHMQIPESTECIEYMLITSKPDRQRSGILNHIALLTPDIQKAMDVIRTRGQHLGYEIGAPRIGRNKKWQLNLFDPDGTRVELMEPFTFR